MAQIVLIAQNTPAEGGAFFIAENRFTSYFDFRMLDWLYFAKQSC